MRVTTANGRKGVSCVLTLEALLNKDLRWYNFSYWVSWHSPLDNGAPIMPYKIK